MILFASLKIAYELIGSFSPALQPLLAFVVGEPSTVSLLGTELDTAFNGNMEEISLFTNCYYDVSWNPRPAVW